MYATIPVRSKYTYYKTPQTLNNTTAGSQIFSLTADRLNQIHQSHITEKYNSARHFFRINQ